MRHERGTYAEYRFGDLDWGDVGVVASTVLLTWLACCVVYGGWQR